MECPDPIFLSAGFKINDLSAVVVMMCVSGIFILDRPPVRRNRPQVGSRDEVL